MVQGPIAWSILGHTLHSVLLAGTKLVACVHPCGNCVSADVTSTTPLPGMGGSGGAVTSDANGNMGGGGGGGAVGNATSTYSGGYAQCALCVCRPMGSHATHLVSFIRAKPLTSLLSRGADTPGTYA